MLRSLVGSEMCIRDRNISTAVLSLLSEFTWIERLPLKESLPLVQLYNNSISELCNANAGRFTGLCALPLADIEAAEIGIIETYLPEPLSNDDLEMLIDDAIARTGAESIRDMGKVMGHVKTMAAGRADMGIVSAKVKGRLGT